MIKPVTLVTSERLDRIAGASVTLACECFQTTGSFKFRAAFHLARHTPQSHLIAASSGNFGQALALACSLLGKSCTVVMPNNAAQVKIQGVRNAGANVDFIDPNTVSRQERVAQLCRQFPDAYAASAFNDPLVIEGNATLGAELAAVEPAFDAILAPIGGGGLAAGLITGLRQAGRTTPVYAVEPELANDAAQSFRAGTLKAMEAEPDTLADGARTVSLGPNPWAVLRKGLADVIEVSEAAIALAVRELFLWGHVKSEPTGALGWAGLRKRADRFGGRRVCLVVSGGNVDPEQFARLIA